MIFSWEHLITPALSFNNIMINKYYFYGHTTYYKRAILFSNCTPFKSYCKVQKFGYHGTCFLLVFTILSPIGDKLVRVEPKATQFLVKKKIDKMLLFFTCRICLMSFWMRTSWKMLVSICLNTWTFTGVPLISQAPPPLIPYWSRV